MKNLVTFFEIPARDFARAVKFYNEFLGMELQVCQSECEDGHEEQMAFFPEQSNIPGAISKAPDFNPSLDGTLIHFNADGKLDRMLESVEKLGGKVLRQKTKIEAEGQGYFALVSDSEGNRIGLHAK